MLPRAAALFCLMLLSAPAMAQAPPPAEMPPATGAPQPLAPLPAQPPPAEPQSPEPQSSEPPSAQPPPSAEPQSPGLAAGEAQSGRVFCGQDIGYRLADPSTIADDYRRFVGVWSDAAWDPRTCAALVVEDVKPDGAASIIYVYGPQGSNSPVAGGVLHGTGLVRGGELRFQNSDGSQFAFRPGIVDMVGHLINPKGESFEATFKETP